MKRLPLGPGREGTPSAEPAPSTPSSMVDSRSSPMYCGLYPTAPSPGLRPYTGGVSAHARDTRSGWGVMLLRTWLKRRRRYPDPHEIVFCFLFFLNHNP